VVPDDGLAAVGDGTALVDGARLAVDPGEVVRVVDRAEVVDRGVVVPVDCPEVVPGAPVVSVEVSVEDGAGTSLVAGGAVVVGAGTPLSSELRTRTVWPVSVVTVV